MTWWRFLGLVWVAALLVSGCTCEHRWAPHDGRGCVLTKQLFSPVEQGHWDATLGSSVGVAQGCLQVAWGKGSEEAATTLVTLDASGLLRAFGRDEPPAITLPASAKASNTRRFRLFVFAPSHNAQATTCATAMARLEYHCIASSQSQVCWFSVDFQPKSTSGPQAQPAPNGSACQLQIRSAGVSEAISEPLPESLTPEESMLEPALDAADTTPDTPITNPDIPDTNSDTPSTNPDAVAAHCKATTDPATKRDVSWVSSLHSMGDMSVRGIAVDKSGAVYVTGYAGDHLLGTGNQRKSQKGIFVAKLRPTGELVWLRRAGQDKRDTAQALVLSADQQTLYVTGSYIHSLQFDSEKPLLTVTPQSSAFVAVFRADTGVVMGSVGADINGGLTKQYTAFGYGIVLDAKSNVYVVGSYQGDFCMPNLCAGESKKYRPFVVKLTPGLKPVWITAFNDNDGVAGAEDANGVAIAVTSSGWIAVLGTFAKQIKIGGATVIATKGAISTFVALLTEAGKLVTGQPPFLLAKSFDDGAIFAGRAMVAGADDRLYMTGSYTRTFALSGGSTLSEQRKPQGEFFDMFVVGYDLKQPNQSWASISGTATSGEIMALGIALGPRGEICVAGSLSPRPMTFGRLPTTTTVRGESARDPFVTCLAKGPFTIQAEHFQWAALPSLSTMNVRNEARAISIGADGQVYLGGVFQRDLGWHSEGTTTTRSSTNALTDGFVVRVCGAFAK